MLKAFKISHDVQYESSMIFCNMILELDWQNTKIFWVKQNIEVPLLGQLLMLILQYHTIVYNTRKRVYLDMLSIKTLFNI